MCKTVKEKLAEIFCYFHDSAFINRFLKLSSCWRFKTISPFDSLGIMPSVCCGPTIPPGGKLIGWMLSTALDITAMLHANLAMFSNVFAKCSCPFRCHFVRGLNLNVRHPFFSFLGNLMFII